MEFTKNKSDEIKSLFLVTSPFQYLIARSAIADFKLDEQACLLVLLPSHVKNSNEQVKSLLKRDGWGKVLTFNQYPPKSIFKEKWNFSERKKFNAQTKFVSAIKEKLGSFSNKLDYIFFGDYRAITMRHIINTIGANKLVMLDDGSITPQVAARRNIDATKKEHDEKNFTLPRLKNVNLQAKSPLLTGEPRSITYYTIYDLNYGRQDHSVPVRHLIDQINRVNFKCTDEIWIIGANHVENRICEFDQYLKFLRFMMHFYRGQKIVYIPHRGEKQTKLAKIRRALAIKIRQLNMPIEFYLLENKTLPKTFATSASTVVDTVSLMFQDQTRIQCFELPDSYFSGRRKKHIKLIQNQHKKNLHGNIEFFATSFLTEKKRAGYVDNEEWDGKITFPTRIRPSLKENFSIKTSDRGYLPRLISSEVISQKSRDFLIKTEKCAFHLFSENDKTNAYFDTQSGEIDLLNPVPITIKSANGQSIICESKDKNKIPVTGSKMWIAPIQIASPASLLQQANAIIPLDMKLDIDISGLAVSEFGQSTVDPFGTFGSKLFVEKPEFCEHSLTIKIDTSTTNSDATMLLFAKSSGHRTLRATVRGDNTDYLLSIRIDLVKRRLGEYVFEGRSKKGENPFTIQHLFDDWIAIRVKIPSETNNSVSMKLNAQSSDDIIYLGHELQGFYICDPEIYLGKTAEIRSLPPSVMPLQGADISQPGRRIPIDGNNIFLHFSHKAVPGSGFELSINDKVYTFLFYFDSQELPFIWDSSYENRTIIFLKTRAEKDRTILVNIERQADRFHVTSSGASHDIICPNGSSAKLSIVENSLPSQLRTSLEAVYSFNKKLGSIESRKMKSYSMA